MSKNIFSFLTGIALSLSALSANAASSVATVPDGLMTFPILHGVTNYLSFPLTTNPLYTTTVASATTTTIKVDDTPAPFTSKMFTVGSPYFVKFLSGSEVGRVMLVTSHTTTSLTLDTTDHVSGDAVALTTTGFSVQTGDEFEVFPGDTLASVFGNGGSFGPLIVAGGASVSSADTVALFTSSNVAASTYYFSTSLSCWVLNGTTTNANNTIIYPDSAFAVTRQANNSDITLTLAGRVTGVAPMTKIAGNLLVYTSSHFAADVTLSQLLFGSKWTQGTSITTADTIGVWNTTLKSFDTFYQMPDSTWRKYPDATTDQSNFTIAAGSVATITKKSAVSGAAEFLQPARLPYSLD